MPAARFLAVLLLASPAVAADPLAAIKTKADLDALTAASAGPKRDALVKHAPDILAAAARRPHVEAVAATVEKASGTIERMNTTPDALTAAFGGPSALFDCLKTVNLASTALGIKAKRDVDPFDAAFYEHVGELGPLEALTILHTTAQNDWLKPLGKLTALKSLNIINQSKLNDDGLAHLAGLKQLERLGYIGTSMTGKPFAGFKGWANLKSCSFRGSKIDDDGLKALCEAFPNLESLVLAHANFTDAAAPHLSRLTKLKAFEIGTRKATPKCLTHVANHPLEYLQLGDGLDSTEGIAVIVGIKTLKKLTLTDCKKTTDADLAAVATLPQLELLELSSLDLPDARLPVLKAFAGVKTLKLIRRPQPYPPETQAAVTKLLPNVAVKFE